MLLYFQSAIALLLFNLFQFEWWNVKTETQFVFSCFATILFVVVYHASKALVSSTLQKEKKLGHTYMSVDCPLEDSTSHHGGGGDTSYSTFHINSKYTGSTSEYCTSSNSKPGSQSAAKATTVTTDAAVANGGSMGPGLMPWVPKKYASKKRLLLRLLHALYGALSYTLALFCMLIAGTMNPALFACLCIGYTIGDFLFAEVTVSEGVRTIPVSNLTETEAQLELKRRELKRVASDQRDRDCVGGVSDLEQRDDDPCRDDGSTKFE